MATITSLFGKHTPFKELQEHMKVVTECAGHTPALVQALIDGDQEKLKTEAKAIFVLEDQADTLKHRCRLHLPTRLFMPVDRRDMLDGLLYQDTIADRAEDIAGMFLQRDMTVPDEMAPLLIALTTRCVEVVNMAGEVISLFDELLEVGFRGKVSEHVEQLVSNINDAETDTDKMERELARILFTLEDTLNPVTVIFWYQVLEWIGDLADYAEKVGNNFRLIIAR
jgi:uncharacterized protein